MNPTVTGALIGAGSAVIVAVAGLWANVRNTSASTALSRSAVETARRTVELTEQGQVADRYTKAIEQLGSDRLNVRIGGIYALEQVARDSAQDHPTVMEVLTAFIREESRELLVPSVDDEPGVDAPRRRTSSDVQAALTVIGRRNPAFDRKDREINRPGVLIHDRYGPNLTGTDLPDANLGGATLANAYFTGANLTGAGFTGANLTGADLTGTKLAGAYFTGADLTGTDLTGANLTGADFHFADLTGADLTRADLTDADLTDVVLDLAKLTDANFTNTSWPAKEIAPEGWQRDVGSSRLKKAGDTNSSGAATG
jgi:hypothetical protein